MQSKLFMASATDTAKPEIERGRKARTGRRGVWSLGSRLGRLIVALNLVGLAILIVGALVLNELRQGLIKASFESLTLQGELIANVIDQIATVGEPEPALEPDTASNVLFSLFIPHSQRARLFDAQGRLLADSYVVADRVEVRPLPPARRPGEPTFEFSPDTRGPALRRAQAEAALAAEVRQALSGALVRNTRLTDSGRRVVSVSIPLAHVRQVLGVLTLEAGDVESIIADQRAALIPFILIAIAVTLLSSFLLTRLVAQPVLRLARAADRVRLSRARAIDLPDLAQRQDELGALARSLEAMTHALSDRMEAIERFAADVAHELRNPMTSMRSAVETLDIVKDVPARERLLRILAQDVGRLDRLITDISNASRLDAELARESPRNLDLGRLAADICAFYEATRKTADAHVRFLPADLGHALTVLGREGPLGQVLRNLVDNARSFSSPGGEVRVAVVRVGNEVRISVEDDGPGMPPENLETVFERFYTARPQGVAFGGNSGLGLAIARQIVETHGGRIWAENRMVAGAVAGARFVVAVPAA
jgi:two-component system sensor histidine kinase ChvG